LIVCDVGHFFESYGDFTGQGKNYAQIGRVSGFISKSFAKKVSASAFA